jgi:transposase
MSDSTPSGADRVFVGLDLHVRNSYLCLSQADGQVIRRGRVANVLGELAEFLGPLERRPVRVVLESTTNTRAMCQLLERYAADAGADWSIEALDARKLRVIAESVCKNDKIDAGILCDLARSNLKLPRCYVPDDEVFGLREHLRGRADLVRISTMLKNRVHGLLHRRGILIPAKMDLFVRAGREWLSSAPIDPTGREIVDRQLATLDQLKEAINASTASVRALSRQQRWCKPQALLQTMPGVGLITGMTILAELGNIDRFARRAAVTNYAGFACVNRRSNDKGYTGSITRRGPAALRAAMVEAAWISHGRVPQYAALFDRVASRQPRQVAIVAVARRMLEDAWTMLKNDSAFRMACASQTTSESETKSG